MVALVLITVISLGVTVYTLLSNKDKKVLAPDYAKPEVEENAEPFGNQETKMTEQPEKGSGNVDIVYKKDVSIELSKNIVSLLIGNPKTSNHDMLVQILIDDLLISESGILKVGSQVKELNLQENIGEQLTSGQYEGIVRVYFYDCISAEKSLVDVKIPVSITVNK